WDVPPVLLAAPELEAGRVVLDVLDREADALGKATARAFRAEDVVTRRVELDPVGAVGAPGERPGHGDPDEGEPARSEEAIDLPEDGLRVRDVLEGVVEHDEVEGAVEIVDVGPEQPHAGRGLSVGRKERVDAGEVREAQIAEVEQEMPRAAPDVEDRVVVPDAGVLQPPDLPGDAEA